MRLVRTVMIAVAVLALVATACSDDDSSDDAAESSGAESPGGSGASGAATAGEVRQVETPEAPGPLRMWTGFGPVPFPATDERTHLDYELYLTNRRDEPITVSSVKVVDADDTSVVIEELTGDRLDEFMVSDLDVSSEGAEMSAGSTSIVYIDTSVESPGDVPDTLAHIVESVDTATGEPDVTIEGAFTEPLDLEVPVFEQPVADGVWTSAEACCFKTHHRRGPLTLNGQDFQAQTYAIDFIKVVDGKLWEGDDPKDLESWYTYGQDALAVVDGTISAVLTDEADVTPFEPNPIPRNIDNVTGNHVIIDMGNGVYVVYAHLAPDSVVVEVGDEVEVGDKLALVGNTGNTDAPHLHIHAMDRNHVVASNPIPFTFASFDLLGTYGDLDTLLPEPFGEVGPADPELLEEPEARTDQYPLELDILEFTQGG